MTNPLHAAYYADDLIHETVTVEANDSLALDTYCLRFLCPDMARRILPGQFLMLRLPECNDPLIGRPLALYDTVPAADGSPLSIDVVYLVKGKLTTRLQELVPGQHVEVWGPLGNGFLPRQAEHLIMVAGGIGQTPFLALAQEYLGCKQYGRPLRSVPRAGKVTLCYGARTHEHLAGVEDFRRIGVDVRISTDDGSRGKKGFVTEVLREVVREAGTVPQIVCCGPEPMMAAVAKIAREANTPCEVSLEAPMACGIGICFTCVAKVRDASGQWDYKRTCVEGPVFDAERIEWS
ncbi:MAG TPA: dihydroorotate dehydrogenase electron transfer subunit [Pirellulaceae bacterium]|nr:dihydroorotate dehydrogenase electron transfer subunit [Pirellulaceae bacterium]